MGSAVIAASLPALEEHRSLSGCAVAYNVPARLPGYTEVVAPGAFTNLRSPSIRFTREHSDRLLARTGSGTLRLLNSPTALNFEVSLPRTEDGRATWELAQRQDYPGVSIGFYTDDDEWSNDGRHRTIRRARLDHIAATATPAYEDTSIQTASRRAGSNLEMRRSNLWTGNR